MSEASKRFRRRRIAAVVSVIAVTSLAFTGCSSGSSKPSASPSHKSKSKLGGVVSLNMVMTRPTGKNKQSFITGTLMNEGAGSKIVKVTTTVAASVSLMNGRSKVSSISIPPAENTELTAGGPNFRLNGVNQKIAPGASIAIHVIANDGTTNPISVVLK